MPQICVLSVFYEEHREIIDKHSIWPLKRYFVPLAKNTENNKETTHSQVG